MSPAPITAVQRAKILLFTEPGLLAPALLDIFDQDDFIGGDFNFHTFVHHVDTLDGDRVQTSLNGIFEDIIVVEVDGLNQRS
jgi:hypothetical protein